MNLKTPDYKAQADNLRATLLNYIDCMQEVQLENEDLKEKKIKWILETEDLKKTAELYKAIIFERDKKIKTMSETIEDLYRQINETKEDIHNYKEALIDEQIINDELVKDNKQLLQKIGEQEDKIKELGYVINDVDTCNEVLKKQNEELKAQYKKVNENTTSLLAKIHELETILNIYEGRKHD